MKNNLRPPWQPGQSGNPKGRSVGSRSKLSEKFIQALHDDFAEHGPGVIEQVRKKQPGVYLKVCGRCCRANLMCAANRYLRE